MLMIIVCAMTAWVHHSRHIKTAKINFINSLRIISNNTHVIIGKIWRGISLFL